MGRRLRVNVANNHAPVVPMNQVGGDFVFDDAAKYAKDEFSFSGSSRAAGSVSIVIRESVSVSIIISLSSEDETSPIKR